MLMETLHTEASSSRRSPDAAQRNPGNPSTPPGTGPSTPPGTGPSTPPGTGPSTPPGTGRARASCIPLRSIQATPVAKGKRGRSQPGQKDFQPQHPWTEAQDELLKKIFGTTNLADRKQAFKTLMPKLRPHTKRAAAQRAVKLGWAVPLYKNRRAWSAAEDALLERYAHLSLEALSTRLRRKGFNRSKHAIHKRRMEIAGYERDNRLAAGYYSTAEAGELLGMNIAVIQRFCQDGTLKADRTPSNVSNLPGYVYRIRAKDLRQFVIDYTAHVRIEKVDKFAFVDLLCATGNQGRKAPGHTESVGVAGESDAAGHFTLGDFA